MDKKISILEHFEELRARIIKCGIFVILASFCVYAFVPRILPVIARPAGKLVFIAPQEAFTAGVMLALWIGLFISLPFIFYQAWRFISSGLKPDERKYTLIFCPVSLVFFVAGAAFGYLVIMPIGMKFLLGFATEILTPMISVAKYISFVGTLVFCFGLVFELPLAALFLTKIGLVTPQFLSRKRRYAVVLIFIAAAALTPPDAVTQCLMAIPLLALYETGILFSKLSYRRNR